MGDARLRVGRLPDGGHYAGIYKDGECYFRAYGKTRREALLRLLRKAKSTLYAVEIMHRLAKETE